MRLIYACVKQKRIAPRIRRSIVVTVNLGGVVYEFLHDLAWVEGMRSDDLTRFFKIVTWFGYTTFYMIFLSVGYWLWSYRSFTRLAVMIALSGLLNAWLKDFWQDPRPLSHHHWTQKRQKVLGCHPAMRRSRRHYGYGCALRCVKAGCGLSGLRNHADLPLSSLSGGARCCGHPCWIGHRTGVDHRVLEHAATQIRLIPAAFEMGAVGGFGGVSGTANYDMPGDHGPGGAAGLVVLHWRG